MGGGKCSWEIFLHPIQEMYEYKVLEVTWSVQQQSFQKPKQKKICHLWILHLLEEVD